MLGHPSFTLTMVTDPRRSSDNGPKPRQPTQPPLATYLLGGVFMAVMLCLAAGWGLTAFGLAVAFGYEAEMPTARELIGGLSTIALSYFVLSFLGAVALWALYRVKGSLLGWMLRGAILAPIFYGVIGLSSVLLYVHAGINLIGFESVEDAWAFLRWSIPVFAVLGGAIWGPIGYVKFRDERSLAS